MDLGSAIKVLLRQWLVILVGLAATGSAAGYLYVNTPPYYQATARMLLLLPADARGAEAIGSPFLYLPNGLNVLARIVAVGPTSRDFRGQMFARGLTSQYEVGVDTASPTLTVSVEGTDPDNVIATRDGLIAAIQGDLLRVQREEDVPLPQIAHARVYAAERLPERVSGDRMRSLLTIVGGGGLLTVLAAFALDRMSTLRQNRRGQRVKTRKRISPASESAPSAQTEARTTDATQDDLPPTGQVDHPSLDATLTASERGRDSSSAESPPSQPSADDRAPVNLDSSRDPDSVRSDTDLSGAVPRQSERTPRRAVD